MESAFWFDDRGGAMSQKLEIIEAVEDLYRVIPLKVLRRTEGVDFDNVPLEAIDRIDAIDRVIHLHGAISPGSVGDVARPWYMHTHQADNLAVLHGARYVDLYTPKHGKVEKFVVTPDRIEHNGRLLTDRAALLVWPTCVFHRIESDGKVGSASINFAAHYDGFDIRTNFSIYDVDTETGEYEVVRDGYKDQPTPAA
jgi:hypothetical protein